MKREDGVCVAAARCSSIMPLARSGELPPADAKDEDVPSPTALLHKLRALHSEARKVYGLDLFTAFLCDGGTKIETVVDSKDAAIAQVMMKGCAKQCQLATLNAIRDGAPGRLPSPSHVPSPLDPFSHAETQNRSTTGSDDQPHHKPDGAQVIGASSERITRLHQEKMEMLDGGSSTTPADAESGRANQSESIYAEQFGADHAEQFEEEHNHTAKRARMDGGGWSETDSVEGGVKLDGVMHPAPPGWGAAALWAREAASLKRKIGGVVPGDGEAAGSSPLAKRIAPTNPMPTTNKELAILIRDVIGARPKYGDESARPTYWPDDVPWQKGKSISQMNNVTLRRLARAVLQHQALARERARASGTVVPEGVLGCAQRTKKELSALIRAKLGLRLQYGERKKRPKFWPQNVPWVKGKPLSMMNHAQLSSVFAAMVGAGLCPAGACLEPGHEDSDDVSEAGSDDGTPENDSIPLCEDGDEDHDDTTAEDHSDLGSESGNDAEGNEADHVRDLADGGAEQLDCHDGGDRWAGTIPTRIRLSLATSNNHQQHHQQQLEISSGIIPFERSTAPKGRTTAGDATLYHLTPTQTNHHHPHASDADPYETSASPSHIPAAILGDIMGGHGDSGAAAVSAGGGVFKAGALLSFPSLGSLASLPLAASGEDDLNPFGEVPASASVSSVGYSSATPLCASSPAIPMGSVLPVGYNGGSFGAYGCGGGNGVDGVGKMAAGSSMAGGNYAALDAWVIGDGV